MRLTMPLYEYYETKEYIVITFYSGVKNRPRKKGKIKISKKTIAPDIRIVNKFDFS